MSTLPAESTTLKRVTLGGTIRLTHARPDGGVLEMSVTRGEQRSVAVYAVTDAEGRLRVASARSWPNTSAEPVLAREVRQALTQAQKITP
ncbi:hypothetical protein [Streptomyces albidoflavus]|uniref:hypothetical protein n=1 Tax=Streptomyces albidoflavus TaxID=1886 RepID=UPI0033DCF79F